jgi:lipid-A-disaccharide synthase-like uncharacterized protein
LVLVVIGITYGTIIGVVGHVLLFRHIENNKRRGLESLKGVGMIFFLRYVLDAVAVLLYALVTRDGLGIVAAALSITVAVKISLIVVYTRKGGKIG